MKKYFKRYYQYFKTLISGNYFSSKSSFEKNKKNLVTFLVLFPLITSSLYFYTIGRKRYFVRSDVVVRKASQNNNNSLDISSILIAGNQSSLEDSFFLQTYLESPQVLRNLENVIDIEKAYKKKGLDYYAGLKRDPTIEQKYNFFRKQVSISLNERTGILRIRSLGLDPQTTYDLNNFLINKAEYFVNELNQSIYKEQLNFLNEQVAINAKRLEKANDRLAKFQQEYQILDVQSEASMTSSFIRQLESQLVSLKVELASIQRKFVDQKSPEIILLKDQIEELSNQISIERNLLLNPEGKNFSKRIIEINELKSNQEFAYDLYIAALKAAEKANVDSVQQQRFLAIISEPQIPEQEWMYWRHRGFFTSLSIFIIIFSVTKFLLGMADSHNN